MNDSLRDLSRAPHTPRGIPKILMQTYKSHDIPENWLPSQRSIKKYLPEWEYHFLTDDGMRDFCMNHFDWFLPYFDAFEYNIQRVDAIRPMWLYVHGGVYMDMDYEVTTSDFSTLFEDTKDLCFVPSANVTTYYTNSLMASRPGNPFWISYLKGMIEPLPWYKHFGKHFTVMYSTGPMILTNMIKEELNSYDYTILPSSKLTPCSVCDLGCDISEAYIRPLAGSSWVSTDTKLYEFCICNTTEEKRWLPILLFLIFLLVLIYWMLPGYLVSHD